MIDLALMIYCLYYKYVKTIFIALDKIESLIYTYIVHFILIFHYFWPVAKRHNVRKSIYVLFIAELFILISGQTGS